MADRPSLFIANGAGFSPIRSLLEHGVAQGRIEQFHVYRFAEPGTPLYLENCCRAWADSIENFTYQRFDLNGDFAQVLTKMADGFPSLDGFDAYVAGTEAFTAAAKTALMQKGLSEENLQIAVVPG